MTKQPKPGDVVRLTGEFLRNTGQQRGGEGADRFLVVEHSNCGLCASGRFVAVNMTSFETPDGPMPRHFNIANLEKAPAKRPEHLY